MNIKRVKRTKLWIGILIVVALILGSGYTFASTMQWQALEESSAAEHAAVQQKVKTVLDSSIDRSTHRTALSELSAISYEVDALCHSSWWYGWQSSIVPSAKQSLESCKSDKASLGDVTASSNELHKYLTAESSLVEILKGLQMDTKELTDKNVQTDGVTPAQTALWALKELNPADGLAPTAKEASKRVATVVDKWNTLVAADKKEDKLAYETAIDELDQAYVNLANITDVSDAQVTLYVSRLEEAAKSLE